MQKENVVMMTWIVCLGVKGENQSKCENNLGLYININSVLRITSEIDLFSLGGLFSHFRPRDQVP